MYGQLIPCGGGVPIPLTSPRMVVGRTNECDLTLPFATVSSKHCLLELRDGVWHVSDLASRNGVRVNGVKCQESRLVPGSTLALAEFRFQVDYGPKGGASGKAGPEAEREVHGTQYTVHGKKEGAGQQAVGSAAAPGASSAVQKVNAPAAAEGPARRDLGELIPCGGGAPIALTKTDLIIGRSRECDITLPYPTVSGKHCQLEFKEGFWHVKDLGSRNGIRVSGMFYLSKFLRPGEVLWVDKYRFEVSYTPEGDEPPAEENPFEMSLLERSGMQRKLAAGSGALGGGTDDEESKKRWKIEE